MRPCLKWYVIFESARSLAFTGLAQLVDRLVSDIMEVTEGLIEKDSPMHALNVLGSTQNKKPQKQVHKEGKLDENSAGKEYSGTYAKTC